MDNYEKKEGDYVYHIKTIKAVSSFVEDYNLSSNNLFHDAGLRLQNRSRKKINKLYGCEKESGFIEEFSKDEELYYVGFRNPEVENKYGLTKKSVAEDFTQEKLEEYSNSMACTEAAEWFEALEKGDKLQKFYTVEDIYNRGEYINIKESVGKYFSEEHLNKIKEKDNYSERAEIEDYWVKIKPGKELSEKYIEDNIFRVDPPEEINGEGIEIISGSNACSSGYQVSKDFKIMKCSGGGTAAKFKDGIFQGKTFENECKYAGFNGAKIKNTKESIHKFLEKINL